MTRRRRAALVRRNRRRLADLLRSPTLYALHLWGRLPRDRITRSMQPDCEGLAREWLDDHRDEVEEIVGRYERGEVEADELLDELCDRVCAWARERTGIDFLEHDPCPY